VIEQSKDQQDQTNSKMTEYSSTDFQKEGDEHTLYIDSASERQQAEMVINQILA